ncbi:MAG: DUF1836 domain-containing protein [Eubacteriales bacterium]|nr:DUF1836 domain-containing protein [Eubacteriales bacterium]
MKQNESKNSAQPEQHRDVRAQVERLADDIAALGLVDLADIPKIGLYMEQVTSFFDDMLQDACRNPDEKILTKTMINNYTKEGILPRPVNKKYDREHMIKLAYIFMLKQTLALQDIKPLLDTMDKGGPLEGVYQAYLELVDEGRVLYRRQMRERLTQVEDKLRQKGMQSAENLEFLLVMQLMGEAMWHKLLAGRLLDEQAQAKREKG